MSTVSPVQCVYLWR